MTYRPENPLIVQGDQSVLAEVASPRFGEARDRLARFAELVKSPEHVHTYRITPLSVWNACAAGADPEEIVGALRDYAKYPVPANVERTIRDAASRYGRLRMERDADGLVLACDEPAVMEEVSRIQKVAAHLGPRLGATAFRVETGERGRSSRRWSRPAGPRKTWPATRRASPCPSRCWPPRARGRRSPCARTRRTRRAPSTRAAASAGDRASSCSRAARERRWWGWSAWRARGAPPSSSPPA